MRRRARLSASRRQVRPRSARLVVWGVAAVTSMMSMACSRIEPGGNPAFDPGLVGREARSDDGMVASGSIEATRAGVSILERGGTAVDAAVATAFALGVADPGGSGLGGMTYVLLRMADGSSVAIDGTAPAPLAVNPKWLQQLREQDRLYGYLTVAVPTTVAALDHTLERYGTMPLDQVLRPAIEIAEQGYLLSRNQITWLETYLPQIMDSRYLRFTVLEDGIRPGNEGDRRCRPALAETLRRVAAGGADEFYRGSVALEIENDMVLNGGFIRRADLALVRVRELRPVRSGYRDVELISFPPPGGGGIVAETMNILESFEPGFLAEDSPQRLHVLVEAFRIAASDNRRFMPDPNRVFSGGDFPHLDDRFAAERAGLITPDRAIPESELGWESRFRGLGEHTTHLSVVDRFGNAVSMTQTLGRQFGAKVEPPTLGFPYNCLLETFDYHDADRSDYLRPRARYPTDMAPTIVVRNGAFFAALGSAGSERVPELVAQVVSNLVDRRMSLGEAVRAPRVLWAGVDPAKIYLEMRPPVTESDADSLEALGFGEIYRLWFPPRFIDLTFFGGVNAVAVDPVHGGYSGIGDPRRSGHAEGPRVVAGATQTPDR